MAAMGGGGFGAGLGVPIVLPYRVVTTYAVTLLDFYIFVLYHCIFRYFTYCRF